MKLTALHKTETVGLGETADVSIEMNAQMFKLLSKGVYSDIPRAIIRELACNAYDSHVEAGKRDVPIRVKLPNTFEPVLTIKDEGTGLSHEQMMTLYTTYGRSTKTGSNDFVGMLGIGSKSPLAYTDTFNVVSTYNGERRSYVVFIDNGFPRITLADVEPTSEPNGLEVSLTVMIEDISKFVAAAERTLQLFEPQPIVTGNAGFTMPERKYVVTSSDWALRQSSYDDTPQAIMGNVAYRLSYNVLYQHLPDGHRDLLNAPLDIWFGIGELEPQASREGLNYDPRTIEAIKQRFAKIHRELIPCYQRQFDGITSRWEAVKTFVKIGSDLPYELKDVVCKHLTFMGEPLEKTINLRSLDFKSHIDAPLFALYGQSDFNKIRLNNKLDHHVLLSGSDEDLTVVWHDGETKGPFARLMHHFRDGPHPVLLVEGSREAMDKVAEYLGLNYIPITDLEKPKPERRSSSRTRKKLYRYDGTVRRHQYTYDRKIDWEDTHHILEQGGIYVELHNRRPVKYSEGSLLNMLEKAQALGLFEPFDLFGLPASMKKVPEKYPGWFELGDILRSRLQKYINENELSTAITILDLYQSLKFEELEIVDLVKLLPKSIDPDVTRIQHLVEKMRDGDGVSGAVRSLAAHLGIDLKNKRLKVDFKERVENLRQKYPLLPLVAKAGPDKAIDAVTDYIKAFKPQS